MSLKSVVDLKQGEWFILTHRGVNELYQCFEDVDWNEQTFAVGLYEFDTLKFVTIRTLGVLNGLTVKSLGKDLPCVSALVAEDPSHKQTSMVEPSGAESASKKSKRVTESHLWEHQLNGKVIKKIEKSRRRLLITLTGDAVLQVESVPYETDSGIPTTSLELLLITGYEEK